MSAAAARESLRWGDCQESFRQCAAQSRRSSRQIDDCSKRFLFCVSSRNDEDDSQRTHRKSGCSRTSDR